MINHDITAYITMLILYVHTYITWKFITGNSKFAKLVVTVLHAIMCVIVTTYFLYSGDMGMVKIVRYISVSYFIYDTYWHVKKWSWLFIGHHLASILVFVFLLPVDTGDWDGNLVMIGIWAGEIGNFSVYWVNYKIYTKQAVTKVNLFLEAVAFVLWRNIFGIMLMVCMRSHLYRFCVFSFWVVSCWWGLGVSRQLVRKISEEYKNNTV